MIKKIKKLDIIINKIMFNFRDKVFKKLNNYKGIKKN